MSNMSNTTITLPPGYTVNLGQTYVYPDGTKSVNKPKDGQVFSLHNPVTNSTTDWMWDEVKGNWFVRFQPGIWARAGDFVHISISPPKENKCECGSEKAGSNRHSTWCSKWTQDG